MMGRSRGGGAQLFYSLSLEDKIPEDHLLRRIDRTEERFGIKPHRLMGDKAYGTANMFQWLVRENRYHHMFPYGRRSIRISSTDRILYSPR